MGDEYQLRKDVDELFTLFYQTKFVKFSDDSTISEMTLDEILDYYNLKELMRLIQIMQDKITDLEERVEALEDE